MNTSTAETIVKVWAILTWIGAAFTALGALGMMFFSSMMGGMMGLDALSSGAIAGFGIVGGVLMLGFAVLGYFIGSGLWKHQSWARIVTLVFSVLGVLGIFSGNFLGAIIGAIGIWLFGFEPTVTGLFGAKPMTVPTGKPAAKKKR